MANDRISRRKMVALSGGIALTGLAGCAGSPSGDSEGNGESTHGHDDETDAEGTNTSHSDGHGHGNESSSGSGHGGALGEPVQSATVRMVTSDAEQHFDPHVVRVVPGGSVTFELVSGAHSATAYAPENDRPQRIPDGAAAWDSGTLSNQGATYEHTFETEGVYDYFCRPHESMGMIGCVVVGDPALDGQPGVADPQSSLPDAAKSKIESMNSRVTDSLG